MRHSLNTLLSTTPFLSIKHPLPNTLPPPPHSILLLAITQPVQTPLNRRHQIPPPPLDPSNPIAFHNLLRLGRMQPVDFIRSIASDHVQNRFIATGVVFHPGVYL